MKALLDRFAVLADGGRISDGELARLLGYRNRAAVTRIVRRHMDELAALAPVLRVYGRRVPRPDYWLDFEQVYTVLLHSRADAAFALRAELIATFLAMQSWPGPAGASGAG